MLRVELDDISSLHDLLQVLFRVNFLVVLLCLTMNRPYQFYYFVPLVTFWFLVVYAVLGVWPRVDSKSFECTLA